MSTRNEQIKHYKPRSVCVCVSLPLQACQAAVNDAEYRFLQAVKLSSIRLCTLLLYVLDARANEFYDCDDECSQGDRTDVEATSATAAGSHRHTTQLTRIITDDALLVGIHWG